MVVMSDAVLALMLHCHSLCFASRPTVAKPSLPSWVSLECLQFVSTIAVNVCAATNFSQALLQQPNMDWLCILCGTMQTAKPNIPVLPMLCALHLALLCAPALSIVPLMPPLLPLFALLRETSSLPTAVSAMPLLQHRVQNHVQT